MTDHPVPPSSSQGDVRLAQRRDVPTGLSTGMSVFGDSSPASSLPVALAHSPWASPGHPTWVLVIGRPFAGGVHEARDGACSEQRPSASPGEKTAGLAHLPDYGLSSCVLASVPVSGPPGSGDSLAFPPEVIRLWLPYLGLSSALPTPTFCHFWCSLQPGEDNVCVVSGPWNSIQNKD